MAVPLFCLLVGSSRSKHFIGLTACHAEPGCGALPGLWAGVRLTLLRLPSVLSGGRWDRGGVCMGAIDIQRCFILWEVNAAIVLSMQPVLGGNCFPFSITRMPLISSSTVGATNSSLLEPREMNDGVFSSPRNRVPGFWHRVTRESQENRVEKSSKREAKSEI